MPHSPGRLAARLLPLCAAIACQGEPTTPTSSPASVPADPGAFAALVTDNVVATLTVVPDSQMVFVGDTFQVTARPKNKAGQLLDKIVRWSVVNASVVVALDSLKPTMTFRALRTGTTSVKATVDAKYRSSKVVVRSFTGAKVVLTPATATVAGGATVQFVATGRTSAGEAAAVNVTWTATGGTVSPTGVLTGGNTPGTYRVIATARFGAADTSVVTVTPAPTPVAAVILVPATASVVAGATLQFAAYGLTSAGDSIAIGVTYSATGGTIAADGGYTAPRTGGSYRVIARSASGVADTSEVAVSAAPIARVTLLPDVAASRPGEKTQFVPTVWNTLGDVVPEPVAYEASCGTATGAGVFTAPPSDPGPCLVVATAQGQADTTEVQVLANTPDQGIPFGVYNLWTSTTTTRSSGAAAYTASHDFVPAAEIVAQIAAARAHGVRLVLAMTGGSHDRYTTNGVFDLAKWQAAMDEFDTPAIRDAVAEGVADGTVIGNSVMDEPQQSDGTSSDPAKSWGPAGTMTKARVDGLCAYVKGIFPTLPAGVGHDHAAFQPDSSYQVCEFFMGQYAARKGNVLDWRDGGLAMAARDHMVPIFSLNLLNGGPQDKTGVWDCPGTGGLGTRKPNCRMTPAQVRDWGTALGQAGCAMLTWEYDTDFMAKPENQSALSSVAIALAALPRTRCSVR